MKQDRILQSWRDWLSSDSRGWRVLVGFVCVIFLALFLHFRSVQVESLELDAPAGTYVVARVDFEFPDDEATIVLRQQAMKDIGHVYQIEDKQVRDARYHLEDLLIHSKQWKQEVPNATFEEMYKVADEVETLLLEARFTDARTIQRIKNISFSDFSYYEFVPDHGLESVVLPVDFWKGAVHEIFKSGLFHRETVLYVVHVFQQRQWTFVEDSALEQALKVLVAKSVPQKFTEVSSGTQVINAKEIVTSRHLAMMQAMKSKMIEKQGLKEPLTIVSSLILSLIFVTISTLYFRIGQASFIRSLRQISLFVCIVILTLLFAKLIEYVLLKNAAGWMGSVRYPLIVPFATILVCILLSPKTALFAATFLSIILSVSLAVDHSRFLILNLVSSIVIIIGSQGIRRRKEVFTVALKSWLSVLPVLYAFVLGENRFWSSQFAMDVGSSFVFLIMTAILVVGLLPALETAFGVLTDMSLMEYMDPSSDLLKEFSSLVPGTYHHSLILGNLAESCAAAIQANGLFCRAATLYHDIGKMNNPQFYTENQQNLVNMHQLFTPKESAQVIISHVTDGVTLARKHHLPEPFIDIIKEHHGTTLVYYFYHKELELKGGRKEEVNENEFRYPGPKPKSKESAIIMICDSVEAASRSIDQFSEASITEVVNRIITEKEEDGQLDECSLTFEELSRIRNTLIKTLLITHHVRVKYPKRI